MIKTILKKNILAIPFVPQIDFASILSVPVSENLKYEEVPFLLDNGLDFTAFPAESELYTTIGVRDEGPRNRYWVELEKEGHVLPTYTRSDFRDNSGVVQVTGMGIYAGISTNVSYSTQAAQAIFPNGNSSTVTLTSERGIVVYVSSDLSEVDFGILVNGVAFPYMIVTQDTGLGWCSAPLSSYRQESKTGKLIRWDYKLNN